MKKIHVFLFNGFADWEIAHLAPEINKHAAFELIYFSGDGQMVTSMGGLQVLPTIALNDLKAEDIDLLILPGGTAWEQGKNKEIAALTLKLFQTGKAIGAICAATTFLAQLGILNELKHTSNDLGYLKAMAPEYTGADKYQQTLAYSDRNIITASGIAAIEFAKEIFIQTQLKSSGDAEKWYQLFKNGVWSE